MSIWCALYFRNGTVYVASLSTDKSSGIGHAAAPFFKVESLSPREIGEAVIAALDASKEGVRGLSAQVRRKGQQEFYNFLGVKSWSELERTATSAGAARESGTITIYGDRLEDGGFEPDDTSFASPSENAEAVGRAVLQGLKVPAFVQTKRSSAAVPAEPDGAQDDPNGEGPSAFGYKIAWIAVPSQDGHALAEAMGLKRLKPSSWASGLEQAHNLRGVFVTPPMAAWTLALGNLPEASDSRFLPLMEQLSRTFQQAFYFGTHRVVEYQAWAIAKQGKTRRAFAWVGEQGEFVLNIGRRIPEEIELETGLEDFERAPDEETVLNLASRWVFDPRELDQQSAALRGPGWFASRKP
jgi:hypothetical protein